MPESTLITEYLPRTDAQRLEARWLAVERCPACDEDASIHRGAIPNSWYAFGAEQVPVPASGIAVRQCPACGLVYKSRLPAPAFLARLFERHAAGKWGGDRDFTDEVAELRQLSASDRFDILDVGAAGGALLKACLESDVRGRRSALDVFRYPGIEAYLAGEFIAGFLDQPSPEWAGEPYGVVTVFDVLEHLYQPRNAFRNLAALVRHGGLVFLETGDAESFWPRRFGVHRWWYARLLEHHVFWTRRSLEAIATAHGFEIVRWKAVRHKSRRDLVLMRTIGDLVKSALYWLAPDRYSAIAELFGKHGNQPWYPFTHDHIQACLRRI